MKKCVRRLSFLVLVLVTVLNAGVATAQTHAYITAAANDAVVVYDASTYAFVTSVPLSPGSNCAGAAIAVGAWGFATKHNIGIVVDDPY